MKLVLGARVVDYHWNLVVSVCIMDGCCGCLSHLGD